jgi:DNA-binding MarR family transcriptional regulator
MDALSPSEHSGNVVARAMAPAATRTEPDRLEETELRAWRGLLKAHASLVKRLDAQLEAEHGLPLTSYEVLVRLADADDCKMRMHDIASSVWLSRSGLTRLIDRLERDGLVTRKSCPHDARGAFAVLTDAGRQKLAEARQTHMAGVRELFLSRFSEPELTALSDMWERVLPSDQECCSGP